MDVNNTPYCLLRSADEFGHGSSRLRWHAGLGALVLAQDQPLRLPATDPAAALLAWAASTPLGLDRFNQTGRLSADGSYVEFNSGRGFLPLADAELAPVSAPVGRFVDMSLGGDGRLALPCTDNLGQHRLVLFHLARRWQTQCALDTPAAPLSSPPRRAWVDADNNVWLISADQLLLCQGQPLPLPYQPSGARFEPLTLNPAELQLRWRQSWPAGWQALALCGDSAQLYVLGHNNNGAQAILCRPRTPHPDTAWEVYPCAADVPFVIDLAMAADSSYPVPGRLAALAPVQAGDAGFSQRDATLLELQRDAGAETGSGGRALLVRERYPMLALAVPRFVSSAGDQLCYQAPEDPDYPGFSPRPRELHALRRPHYPLEATALLHRILDSGQPDSHWHRLYLDASIPPGCAIEIGARVYASPEQRGAAAILPQPAPLWNPLPSELGFASALAEPRPGCAGLFEILLQRPSGPVRRLCGRYLQLQVTLRGNGRQTPCLHAIRVYYPRFSYQEAWLPELFRQEHEVDPAAAGPANGADTRERLLAAFESILTPLEGRIAASDQLLHPQATPAAHLPWLAGMLGGDLPGHWPEARQRRQVGQLTALQQDKGTLAGVNLALDIATDGGVQRGEVVLVENFRLRRTLATLLGISMDDSEHPLTLGTGMSGNSIVGDSLILAETDAREFLALLAPEQASAADAATVQRFFEQYAQQITVLLHGRAHGLRATIEALLPALLPAHLHWRVFATEHPFVPGLAPLLAVDTFIGATPAPLRVRLNTTRLGREGALNNPAAFSPADINTRAG